MVPILFFFWRNSSHIKLILLNILQTTRSSNKTTSPNDKSSSLIENVNNLVSLGLKDSASASSIIPGALPAALSSASVLLTLQIISVSDSGLCPSSIAVISSLTSSLSYQISHLTEN